jgi:hypothetical protein
MVNNPEERIEFDTLHTRIGDTLKIHGEKNMIFTVLDMQVIYNPQDFNPTFRCYRMKKPFKTEWINFNKIYETNEVGIFPFNKKVHVSRIVYSSALLVEKKMSSIYKYEI